MSGLEKRICVGCGKEFKAIINSTQKYHSGQCSSRNRKKVKFKEIKEEEINKLKKINEEYKKEIKEYNTEEIKKNQYRVINSFEDYMKISSDKKEPQFFLKLPHFSIVFVKEYSQIRDKKTKPEKIFFDFLTSNNMKRGTEFIYQYYILKKYFVDFYFPSINLGVEIYGDYWHANPDKYKSTDILKYPYGKKLAKDIWEKDKKRESLIKKEINLIKIWETDMLNNSFKINKVINELQKIPIV